MCSEQCLLGRARSSTGSPPTRHTESLFCVALFYILVPQHRSAPHRPCLISLLHHTSPGGAPPLRPPHRTRSQRMEQSGQGGKGPLATPAGPRGGCGGAPPQLPAPPPISNRRWPLVVAGRVPLAFASVYGQGPRVLLAAVFFFFFFFCVCVCVCVCARVCV